MLLLYMDEAAAYTALAAHSSAVVYADATTVLSKASSLSFFLAKPTRAPPRASPCQSPREPRRA